MSNQPLIELIEVVCPHLEALGICYAITGSVASAIHGEPYSSLDVDIALRMTEKQALQLAERLPARFYREPAALVQAVRDHTMVNLIDNLSPLKVDLSVLPAEDFYQGVLERRRRFEPRTGAPPVWVVSPEDIVLMKLIWRLDTGSHKQWENALSVVRTQGSRMDWRYMHEWAARMGVVADLERLKSEAGL